MAQERSLPGSPLASASTGEMPRPQPRPINLADTLVMPRPHPRSRPRPRRRRWVRVLRALLVVVVVLLLLLGIAGAVCYENPALLNPVGGLLLGGPAGAVPWNGADPVNILVMGIDQRGTEQTRSDSMIVLRVDPSSHDVEMLSVPRDLWVDVPGGYGSYKINAGYALGQPSGQGPQFAAFVVESALRIPINYYAVMRFSGFKSVIDAMGGVTVCVPHELYDTQYPDDTGYGVHTIDIKAGCQTMDGTTALVYARERHANAQQDLGRVTQQQAVLDGVEKGLFSPATLPRLPGIISAVNGAMDTDLPRGALPELGMLLGRARGSHTRHAYLNTDGGYVTSAVSSDGQDILDPNWDRVRPLVTSLFADARLQRENAVVGVLNGQQTVGLAGMYTTLLANIGFNTVAPADASTNTQQHTTVTINADHPGGDYTARVLGQMLRAVPALAHLGAAQPQVVVSLGADAIGGSGPSS